MSVPANGQMYAGQQFVQSQQQAGYPPQQSGVPQMPQGQQTQGSSQQGGYTTDYLPPPAQPQYGQQPQQQAPQQNYGFGAQQPGVPGTQIQQPQVPQQYGAQPGQYPTQQQIPQGYQVQQQPSQPQQQWPQGQPAQQQNRWQPADNQILDGADVPQELRGRTWGDARRLFTALSTDWLQRNGRPQTPAQQSLQQMQPQGQPQQQWGQPQGQQQPQQGQQPQFWQNPDARIAEVVRQQLQETIMPALQPMVQQSQANGILQARQVASTGMQDFQYLEPDIMQIVAGATPEELQNPQVWVAAARMARGQRMEQGQYQPQVQRQQIPQPQPQGYGPGYSVPAQQPHTFFSEGPSMPSTNGYGMSQGPRQPTTDELQYAQRWGMPVEQFMSWKYGQAGAQ